MNDERKKNANSRAMFYKKPIKRDNYRLEVEEEETPQEIRRQQLLLRQKKQRDDLFQNGRGLIEQVLSNYQDDADDEEEEMEIQYQSKQTRKHKYRKNNLMLSEWMLEVPEDFCDKWTMLPCPIGKRILLVATKGITKAYNRQGRRLSKFHSALPGGNTKDYYHKFTLLDCIWQPEEKKYYALDVLAWSNQCFMDCDTDFRFYWMQSKINENEEFREINEDNSYPIVALPSVHCNGDLSEFLCSLENSADLDGLLFYHREGHYTRGRTPLVTWLKPYMLSEVLGIFVPEEMNKNKPSDYIDAQHFFATKGRRKKRNENESSMEYNTIDDQQTEQEVM